MENIWKIVKGPDKALSRVLALTLAVALVAALFMTAWGSLDISTNTILSFESGVPVVNLTVDTGTEQPYLPDTLRAVVKLADIEPEAQPAQPSFIQETPLDTYDYQAVGGGLYTYTDQTGAVSYRVYGSYSGSAPTWFACDENGDVNGILQEIPVSWSCADYDKETPGTYTFTSSFTGYTYAGPLPFAVVTTEDEVPISAPEEPPAPGEKPTLPPTPAVQTNSISGKLWLDKNADGVMDETESGVAFYPIHLYAADDTGVAVQSTQTEEGGTYRFESLEPGSYVVGIFPETIGVIDYLLPVAGLTQDNRFEPVEIGEEFMAMCAPIEIEEDTAAADMNAGVRFAPEMTPFTIHNNVSNFYTLKSIVENTAQSGDTIVISDKIDFTGVITIKNKSLTFISKDASTPMVFTAKNSRHFMIEGDANNNIILTFDNVILDGGKLGGGIELAAQCSLQLVTPEIRNCLAHGTAQNQAGAGAINTAVGSNLTVTNGKIYDNVSTDQMGGGGIYANSSTSVTLNGCDIYENTASANGGGIYVGGLFLELTLNNCNVEKNQALNGGGIYSLMAIIKVNGGEISGNRAIGTQSNGNGGGIYLGHLATTGSLTLNSGKISGNTANGNGGGIYAASKVEIDMSQGTISGNTAASGGGIYTNSTTILTLDNCKVENNTAKSHPGGGIFGANATIYVNGGAITGNTSGSIGGGIYVAQNSALFVDGADISGNTAKSISSDGGGGIYVLQSTLTIEPGSTITKNRATCGGGIYGINNATITINGGEILENHALGTAVASTGNGGGIHVTGIGTSLTVKGGLIANNDATVTNTNTEQGCGGGIAGFSSSTITISGGTLEHNTAKYNGGGIYAKQSGLLIEKNCKIQYNNANLGAGVFSSAFSLFQVTGGEISENTATKLGGGIYSLNNANNVISGGKIHKNNAEEGGGIYIYNGVMNISGGEISQNTATMFGGGLYGAVITDATVSGGKISGNKGNVGGGLYIGNTPGASCTMTVSGGEISDNISTSNGGGIYIVNFKSVSLTGIAKVFGNTAAVRGGGLHFLSVPEINVTGNVSISGNTADSGGGIFTENTADKITVSGDAKISGNHAAVGGGMMIHSSSSSSSCTVTVSGGEISDNISTGAAGGIYCSYVKLVNLTGSAKISGNTAAGAGGGLYFLSVPEINVTGNVSIGGNKAVSGGGIFAAGITGKITVSGDAKIFSNNAAKGGGIHISNSANCTMTVNGGEISDNISTGDGGGGIYATELGKLLISGGEISGNTATMFSGGGIFARRITGGILVSNGKISGNAAILGGGIALESTSVDMSGGEITGNTAGSIGGGILTYDANAMVTVTGGSISGNTAPDGGGIYIFKLENLTVDPIDPEAIIFTDNKAAVAFMIDPADIALHDSQINTEHFSSLNADYTFEYAYNNYDVFYRNGKQLCVVSFDALGGSSIPSIVAASGSLITSPSPNPAPPASEPGYIFGGWYKETACINAWNFALDTVTSNITLYAKWLDVVSLTVSNTVSGDYASTSRPFSYTITFLDANGQAITDGKTVTYTGGVIPGSDAAAPTDGSWTLDGTPKTFTLKHGQQITITNIPTNSKVQVTQDATGGYSTSFKDSKDISSTASLNTGIRDLSDNNRVFAFTNTSTIIPTGIFTGSLQGPTLLMLSALLLMGVGLGIRWRCCRHKEGY